MLWMRLRAVRDRSTVVWCHTRCALKASTIPKDGPHGHRPRLAIALQFGAGEQGASWRVDSAGAALSLCG